MSIPLEDSFADIIGKAQRGLALSDSVTASKAGLSPEIVQSLRAGNFDAAAVRLVAPVLGLNARALADLGEGKSAPAPLGPFDGLLQFNTQFDDMTVNAYLVWDPATKEAATFDTGGDSSGIIDEIRSRGLNLRVIYLTHTHGDHIFDLDRLRQQTGAPAFVSSREPLDGVESIEPHAEVSLGSLKIATRLTWGHSRGGLTYFVTGLKRPVAVVGDAVFAGSMGGGAVSYADALRTNREEIISLPDDTIICPGHGPTTSVAEEKEHNPFFATGA